MSKWASTYQYDYGSSTSWTSNDITYVAQKAATILETKPPAKEWTDVVKVKIDGQTWRLDEIVRYSDGDGGGGICKIISFESSHVNLRYVGHGDLINVAYAYIDKLTNKDLKKVRLDPNEAFKQRKKRREIY